MNKVLISYFSASGVTKKVAEKIKDALNGDLFEIIPTEPYTSEDLDWTNKESRSSIEMQDKSSRPSIVSNVENISEYDTIVIGFPVWWYTAPSIINTFIESNDLTNKRIYIFVTSGSSSVEGSINDLRDMYKDLNFIDGKRFNGTETQDDYMSWIK